MKKKIVELLFQIIPVMIGVYLGFVVSNLSEDNKKKNQSKVLIENLLAEINVNESQLKAVIEYHKMLRDSSQFYANPNHKFRNINFFKGTRVMKLTNSAYNTGIQTGIVNELPLDQIQRINNLYTFQNEYNEFGSLMMASLINKDFADNEESIRKIIRFLSITMTDIVIKESDLLKGYEKIKTDLQAYSASQ